MTVFAGFGLFLVGCVVVFALVQSIGGQAKEAHHGAGHGHGGHGHH